MGWHLAANGESPTLSSDVADNGEFHKSIIELNH